MLDSSVTIAGLTKRLFAWNAVCSFFGARIGYSHLQPTVILLSADLSFRSVLRRLILVNDGKPS